VTCAHVVEAAGAGPGGSVTIAFALTGDACPAEVLVDAWRPPNSDDIAILRLQGELPPDVTPAILGPSDNTADHPFRAFGYPEVGDMQGVWAKGDILGPIADSRGTRMLQLLNDGPLVREAVWVTALSITSRGGQDPNAIPLNEIESYFLKWPQGVVPAHKDIAGLRRSDLDQLQIEVNRLREAGETELHTPWPGPDRAGDKK
jgi:hypothetical protein